MKVFVKDGKIAAVHRDDQVVEEFYPGAEVVHVPDGTALTRADGGFIDPAELAVAQAERDRLAALAALKASDADLARGVEDLVGVLEAKGVIAAEDLPEALRNKIEAREVLRSQL